MPGAEFILTLIDRFTRPATAAAQATARLNTHLRDVRGRFLPGVRRETEATGSAFASLGGAATIAATAWSAASTVVGRLGGFVESGAQLVLDSARFRENTLASMETMTGSAQEARRIFAQAAQIARETPLETNQVIDAMRELTVGGFRGNALTTATAIFADVASVQGSENARHVTRILSQIQGGRKLQAELLESLGIAGVGRAQLFAQIARLYGVQVSQVQQLISSGRVSGDRALAAIEGAVSQIYDRGGPVGSAATRLANTLEGTISNFRGAFNDLLTSGSIEQLPGIQTFSQFLRDVTSLFDAGGKQGQAFRREIYGIINSVSSVFSIGSKGEKQGDTLRRIFAGATEVVHGIGSVIKTVLPLLKSFGSGFFSGFTSTLAPVIDRLRDMGAIEPDAKPWESLGKAIGAVAAAFVLAAGAATALLGGGLQGIALLVDTIADGFTGKNNIVKRFETLGADLMRGLADGILREIQLPIDRVTEVATAIYDTAANVLQVQSPSRAFAYLGEMSAAGYSQGFERGSGGIAGTVDNAVSAPRLGQGKTSANTSNSIQVNVEVYAQSNDPAALGEQVAGHVRSALLELLEGTQPEMGAA